jgi:hypothetical protein
MSLMLFGQAEPEPVPEEPAPADRRRYLVILGMVVALILAGGSAAYLILSSNVSVNHGPQGAFPPPGADTPTPTPIDDASASSSAGASASASASASHGASPSQTVSGKPPGGGPGGPGGPGPVTYRVATELCPALDTSPVEAVATGPGTTGGDHTDKSNYVVYTCSGSFGPSGKVRMITEARIFADPAAAAASFAADRTGEHVSGVGTDATAFIPASGGYVLLAVDGNLEFKIQLNGVGGKPTPGDLRQPAIDTIRKSLPRLRT